jgi:hypothetical protein
VHSLIATLVVEAPPFAIDEPLGAAQEHVYETRYSAAQ